MSTIGGDFKNSIVLNDGEFQKFLRNLDIIYDSVEKHTRFELDAENKNALSDIIGQVTLSRDFFASLTGNEKQLLHKAEKFYNDFFDIFEKERDVIDYIQKEMRGYFYITKIYQLSNYLGILYKDEWCKKTSSCKHISPLKDFPNIKYYIYLYYFVDFYESFYKFLKPFLEKMWIEKSKTGHKNWWPPYIPIEIYHIWQNAYPLNRIKRNLKFYNDMRNMIAHSTIYLNNGKIKIDANNGKGSEDKLSKDIGNEHIEKHMERIKEFLYTAITFTTEFDRKMLEVFKESIEKKDAETYELYKEYFKVYHSSWKELVE